MTTEQKIDLIIDRLLVKTQNGLCEWKKNENMKFSLRTSVGIIHLYWHQSIGGKDTIIFDIASNADLNVIIASKVKDKIETESNLVRLFNAVTEYHQNYVNEHVTKILTEIEKLGEQPF